MNLLKPQSIFIIMVGLALFFSLYKKEKGCTDLLALNYDLNTDGYKARNISGKIIGDSIFTILNTKTFSGKYFWEQLMALKSNERNTHQ